MGAPSVAFVKQYQDSIYLLVQQLDTRLRRAVMVDTNFTGSAKFYDQYGTDEMVEIMSRYQDTPVQLPNHARRKVAAGYFVSNTLEDPTDALQMLIDPKSTYMQAKQAAANRKIDDIIIAALGGTAYSGVDGGTSNTLASTNKVAHGGVGMTKAKLLAAKRLLNEKEVDENDRYVVCSEAQFEDLLLTTEVTSADFNIVKPLVEGSLKTWIGCEWIRSERLLQDATATYRLTYMFQKKGLQLAIQKDVVGRIDERPDKNYAWQVYLRMCMGAVRLEEERVVQISCAETLTND